jgi:aldehyde dehydrogenase (NAD+)
MTSAVPNAASADALERFGHHIGGRTVFPDGDAPFVSVNPTTGKPWATFPTASRATVDEAVTVADAAFGPWAAMSPTRRGRLLMRWGDAIAADAERIGRLECTQNGKLPAEMILQARIVADWLYYYGGLADKIEGRVIPLDRTSVLNYTKREPLGVVGVITPWNSPLFLTVMAIAPALAAGNTVVIKPSEVTPVGPIVAAELATAVGIPAGVVNVVAGARETGEAIVGHPQVVKVAFTGGVEGGRAIAEACGRRLVPVTLELGGKSANIVFPDAPLEQAKAGLLAGIFAAAGQTCVAGSRALVHRSRLDEMVDFAASAAGAIRLGNPLEDGTEMGPVATEAQLRKNLSMVERARADGAEVAAGGGRAAVSGYPDGFFFQPTVLTRVAPADYIAQNEVFGPVLSIIPFDDEEEAVAIANGTDFGLAAGVWTSDLRRAHRVAGRLNAGTVWVNMYRGMTFNSPFGGYKQSGIGRQNGIEAMDAYLQTKSVWVELSEDVQNPFVMRS